VRLAIRAGREIEEVRAGIGGPVDRGGVERLGQRSAFLRLRMTRDPAEAGEERDGGSEADRREQQAHRKSP